MAKKFFYDKVHNTKKTIINLIIIGVCIIGIVVCFILTSHFQAESKNNKGGELSIKSEIAIEVNEKINKEIFFSKIENTNLDKVTITYPDNFNVSTPGEYTVTITINNKDYETKLIVVDTIKPELTLKEVTINEKESYSAKDFVLSCTDNSGKDCIIDFYQDAIDEDGNKIVYTDYKNVGTYPIKISAGDESGNQNILETTLIIKKKDEKESQNPKPDDNPTVCKYGDNLYDKNEYLLAVDVSNGGCAISLNLYDNNEEIVKIMDNEQTRIIKDIQKLNLTGDPYIERKILAVTNYTGKGIVGFELRMIYKVKNGDDFDIIADYKIDTSGKRIFTINKYNLNA